LSHILTVAFSFRLSVEVNNRVPAGQVRFQQFRVIEPLLRRRQQQAQCDLWALQ